MSDLVRRNFTIPEDVDALLDKERNKSGTVVEALRLYFKHKETVRRFAANSEDMRDKLELLALDMEAIKRRMNL